MYICSPIPLVILQPIYCCVIVTFSEMSRPGRHTSSQATASNELCQICDTPLRPAVVTLVKPNDFDGAGLITLVVRLSVLER